MVDKYMCGADYDSEGYSYETAFESGGPGNVVDLLLVAVPFELLTNLLPVCLLLNYY